MHHKFGGNVLKTVVIAALVLVVTQVSARVSFLQRMATVSKTSRYCAVAHGLTPFLAIYNVSDW